MIRDLSLALIVLAACSQPAAPKDREADYQKLKATYAPQPGEWETVVRLMSVKRRMDFEDPKVRPEAVKALRSALADTTPTVVIPQVAMAKDLPELVDVTELILSSADKPDDPAVQALLALAEDMRKRGNTRRANVAGAVLEVLSKWSAQKGAKIAVKLAWSDFTASVGRDVIETAEAAEKDLREQSPSGKLGAQAEKQIAELHTFIVERLTPFVEKPDDVSRLRKLANWRDEPDALDHPLISLVATDWSTRIDDFERLKRKL